MPTAKSTIVLNFAQHWFKSAEPRFSKRFSPFKNNLQEQFALMGYELRRTHRLLKFIHDTFYT
ncbi:MAG: hypothetical protein MJZ38_07380, partial [archaeon]|nr:hypothetical protein [archaeon]